MVQIAFVKYVYYSALTHARLPFSQLDCIVYLVVNTMENAKKRRNSLNVYPFSKAANFSFVPCFFFCRYFYSSNFCIVTAEKENRKKTMAFTVIYFTSSRKMCLHYEIKPVKHIREAIAVFSPCMCLLPSSALSSMRLLSFRYLLIINAQSTYSVPFVMNCIP